jgi:hypothetical protein
MYVWDQFVDHINCIKGIDCFRRFARLRLFLPVTAAGYFRSVNFWQIYHEADT